MTKPRCPGQDMRRWTPDDIVEIKCPHCDNEMEFFKDEPSLICCVCRRPVRNPRVDLGCAEWCTSARECLGSVSKRPDEAVSSCNGSSDEI